MLRVLYPCFGQIKSIRIEVFYITRFLHFPRESGIMAEEIRRIREGAASMAAPAYVKLYETLRDQIVSGDYPYGQRLPGKRALADQFGLSVITVSHALDLLSEEGYLTLRERSGSFVSFRPADEAPSSFLPLSEDPREFAPDQPSSADLEGFPFPILARTARRVLSEQGEALLRKSPGQGIPPLRLALSRYLARSQGIQASPAQIVLGAGAEYLYGLLVDFLGLESVWAIESPSYEKIEQVYATRNVRLEYLPLRRDGISSEALRNTSARILHLSPYRSYPSDVTASASRRAEYIRWADQPEHILIEDNYESEFSLRRKPMPPLFSQSKKENVIYLNTFSRTISPALRVGYMVIPERLLPRFLQRAGFYSCTVPAFEQYLLTELIDSGDFERHIRRIRRKLRAAQGG